jgi:hypothetical protein
MLKVVQYRTRSDRAEENEALVAAVFAELDVTRPEHLRYTALRLDDGVTFLHVAEISTDDGSNPLAACRAFAEFQRDLPARCESQPTVADGHVVGDFGLLTGPTASR